ncbi:MAG: transglycosylase SLT domain-containing protein [Deltaproteobacteria bacterium]|nr:transglycosylase SLT domain-containing protein [Deltaproteobacteria bacterium]
MLKLTFLSGSLQGTEASFAQPAVRIGRAPDCDVRFDKQADPEVSAHHAEIVAEGGGWAIIDTASTNGTLVNGEKVSRRRLASGDVLVFGGGASARVELADGTGLQSLGPMTKLTPAPERKRLESDEMAARVRDRADTAALRVAEQAAQKLMEERARQGGKSGKTVAIMADALAEMHQDTKRRSGRRWLRVVLAVAGLGLVVAGLLGLVVAMQRRELQRLVGEKARLDREIEAVQAAMAGESDEDKLAALEQRLAELTGSARTTLGRVAEQDRIAARELEEAGDDLDRAIRRILAKFDAQTYAIPPVFKEALREQVDILARSSNLKFVYKRRNRHWKAITREFAALGLPEEMAYIAWAETQFDPEAVSSAGARGMWQMTPGTARELGLRVDDEVDERLDVPRQTRAAARKLANLLAEFGADSFMLALASYNRGEAGVRRVLHQVAQEKDGFRKEKRDFWHLYRLKRLPAETMDYVPRVLAAAVVCNDPVRYGLETGP